MNLAQFNIAEALDSIDSPIMADFVANVDRINALADKSLGFVWRYDDDEGEDLFSLEAYKSKFILVNMSVWKDRTSLFDYVYKSAHVEIYKRKKEWFSKMPKMHMVLWFIEDGDIPTLNEGKQRLEYLQKHGETPYAFSFKSDFNIEDLEAFHAKK
ncbi:MAG: DUF3291 domain-containing protein [Flavobacteriaceae bacterium]|nr:DUF3291 domain-containing protein [Flavobacteriaceae bacterium]